MSPSEHIPDANDTPTATVPEPPPTASDNGRDARGRFTTGNRGGPGNPFARRTAAFHRALCAAVSEDDILMIAQQLLAKAREGDLAAIKLLLSYVIGRPAEAVNPDTLDLEELRQWQAAPADADEVVRVVTGPETEVLCQLARAVRPTMTSIMNREVLATFAQQEEKEARQAARRQKRRARRQQAPSPNGGNGPAPPVTPPSPSANGSNGQAVGAESDGWPWGEGALPAVIPPSLMQRLGSLLGLTLRSPPAGEESPPN